MTKAGGYYLAGGAAVLISWALGLHWRTTACGALAGVVYVQVSQRYGGKINAKFRKWLFPKATWPE